MQGLYDGGDFKGVLEEKEYIVKGIAANRD